MKPALNVVATSLPVTVKMTSTGFSVTKKVVRGGTTASAFKKKKKKSLTTAINEAVQYV